MGGGGGISGRMDTLGGIVEDISYNNAAEYFGL
jgi:hypothetical protein